MSTEHRLLHSGPLLGDVTIPLRDDARAVMILPAGSDVMIAAIITTADPDGIIENPPATVTEYHVQIVAPAVTVTTRDITTTEKN